MDRSTEFPFRIAIPSYRRPLTLRKKTLRFLEAAGVPDEQIDIFVAGPEERESYSVALGPASAASYTLVVGVPGINRQREFIHDYYPAGARVLCLDDDVAGVKSIYEGVPFPVLVEACFERAAAAGCRLWGVYPTDNGLQLQDRLVLGTVYIIGSLFGMINWKGAVYPDPTTEDFERSLQAAAADGRVARFEGLGPRTSYFKEPGGLQEYRTTERQEAEMRRLVDRWPGALRLRRRPGRWTDAAWLRGEREYVVAPFSL